MLLALKRRLHSLLLPGSPAPACTHLPPCTHHSPTHLWSPHPPCSVFDAFVKVGAVAAAAAAAAQALAWVLALGVACPPQPSATPPPDCHQGSVLTNGAIYLEDTINRRQSKWLSLDTAARGDARVLAGPTDDGWYHIQARVAGGVRWRAGSWVLAASPRWPARPGRWVLPARAPATTTWRQLTAAASTRLQPPAGQLCQARRQLLHQARRAAQHVEQDLHPGQVGCGRVAGGRSESTHRLRHSSDAQHPPCCHQPPAPSLAFAPPPPAGTGYTLQLDTAYLYSSDSFSFQTASAEPGTPFPCVGARCDERPATPAPPAKLVPLLHSGGGEFEVQGAEEVDASTGAVGWAGEPGLHTGGWRGQCMLHMRGAQVAPRPPLLGLTCLRHPLPATRRLHPAPQGGWVGAGCRRAAAPREPCLPCIPHPPTP